MEFPVRTTRTLKVTEAKLSEEKREMLAQLALDPRYEALLDLMESACIELDTALINVPTGDPGTILGAHSVSKAAWLFFTYIQKQVLNATYTRMRGDNATPPPSLEDLVQGVEAYQYPPEG